MDQEFLRRFVDVCILNERAVRAVTLQIRASVVSHLFNEHARLNKE